MRRRLPSILGVVVLLLVAAGTAWLMRPGPVVVDLAPVDRGQLVGTLEEEGRTRVRQRVVVPAPVGGVLLPPLVRVGDVVTAGQVVARMQPLVAPLLLAGERAGLEASVRSAAAAVSQAKATLERARAAQDIAQVELQRQEKLASSGGVARAQLDASRAQVHAVGHDVEAAGFQAQVAAHQLGVAKANLVRATSGERGTTLEVTSPVAGRVLSLPVDQGGPVVLGTPLVEVGDPASLEVVVPVVTDDAGRLPADAQARLSGWGGPDALGRVLMVEPKAFTKMSSLGVEEARVNVVVALDNPPPSTVGDAWRVRVVLVLWQVEDAVRVPLAALVKDGTGHAVFVEEDGRAHRVGIQVGRRSGPLVEVTGGLQPGTRVVLHPGDRVAEGSRLTARVAAP